MAVLTGVWPHLLPGQVIPGSVCLSLSPQPSMASQKPTLFSECQVLLVLACFHFTKGPSTLAALENLPYLLLVIQPSLKLS